MPRATRRRARPVRPVHPLEPLAHPAGEDQESEGDGEVGEDEAPDQDVDRGELPRARRTTSPRRRAPRRCPDAPGRRREVEQEHDQGLNQQDVDEVGVQARARGAPRSRPAACWRGRAPTGSWPRRAASQPRGLLKATTLACAWSIPPAAAPAGPPPAGSAGPSPRRPGGSGRARTGERRSRPPSARPMPPMIVRLPRKRS